MPEINDDNIQDNPPDMPVSRTQRTPEQKAVLHSQAFDMYMNDPRHLNAVQIARELKMEPAALLRYAQNKGWEQLRLQQRSIISTVQNERRLSTAKRVDERIVEAADEAIKVASGTYLDIINKIGDMPLDPLLIPDDELDKDDHGNVKRRPKRAKLLEEKVFLLNQAMDGFMKMSSGAQGIGLVLNNKGIDGKSTSDDLQKLTQLNVLLLNIQKGKGDSAIKAVTEITGELIA
jgi:hypothetical protein